MIDSNIDFDKIFNSNHTLFNSLSNEERNFLITNIICEVYKKGDYIYKEGEYPTGLLFLYQGKAKILKEGIG
ncbi:MAG: cyclic nucleotide-binding domain-containing protein, partial [Bacteroidales bacterium]|nr:cyclic nucleotide-binding domain-containing protein [Bacteroidales bacterium]